MSGDTSSELDAFESFAHEHLDAESYHILQSTLAQYRQRQRELERLREELRPALEEIERGEAREVDFDQLIAEGRAWRKRESRTEDRVAFAPRAEADLAAIHEYSCCVKAADAATIATT